MNYLKSYKVFESSHIDSKLTDCLVELFDYGFELEHVESREFSKFPEFVTEPKQLLRIKLFKRFPKSVGKFSNHLEGEFDKDTFGPGDRNPRTREYMISNMHIEGELIEMTDEASNKIINTYIPEATRGEYIINEYVSSMEEATHVVIVLKFFK
jgi:hypothetical protein